MVCLPIILAVFFGNFTHLLSLFCNTLATKFMKKVVIDATYKHHKGKFYRVLGLAKHSETLEELVYYECLYDNPNGRYWVRPKTMFLEDVIVAGKKIPRFALVKTTSNRL